MGLSPRSIGTVREVRDRFFEVNAFGRDGGYGDAWADAKLGPFRYRVRNLRVRASALRVHDLHHLVAGYPTDWRGEAEISAWELASRGGRPVYAWLIALFGFLTGLLAAPRATWSAFARGRGSRNLFAHPDPAVLFDRPLDELADELLVRPSIDRHAMGIGGTFGFISFAMLALGYGAFALPFLLALTAHGALTARCEPSFAAGDRSVLRRWGGWSLESMSASRRIGA